MHFLGEYSTKSSDTDETWCPFGDPRVEASILSSEAVALISKVRRDMYTTTDRRTCQCLPFLTKKVYIVIRGLFVVSKNLDSTFVFVWTRLFAVVLLHLFHLSPHPIHPLIRLGQTRS